MNSESAAGKLIADEIIEQSVYRFELNLPRINTCLDLLSEPEVWQRPNSSCNSCGNLILHLSGNITQYIISGLGGKKDSRDRDFEFSTSNIIPKNRLLDLISNTTRESIDILRNISGEDLMKHYEVQGYNLTGMAIVIHVVEHYSYHTGQITLLTKLLKNIDTGYYKGLNLNRKNRSA